MSVFLVTLALSILLCGLYLRLARRWQILADPNERSSHHRPTPHGGGAAILLAFVCGAALAMLLHSPWDQSYMVLMGLALVLMLLGIVDDLHELSVRLRFTVYSVCCLVAAALLLPPSVSGNTLLDIIVLVLAALAILWLANLYNFMDGIDGIAASQCILACSAAALLSRDSEGGGSYPLLCSLLAASHLGFLVWNWPPARLFMGDAGSVPTGFLLGCLALLGAAQGQLNAACWLVLLAVFITDASWTLLWRIATGQAFTRPHRLHAYQRLSSRWSSHLRVDLLLVGITVLWLFPLAWAVQSYPAYTLLLVILAYLPLLLGMAKLRTLA